MSRVEECLARLEAAVGATHESPRAIRARIIYYLLLDAMGIGRAFVQVYAMGRVDPLVGVHSAEILCRNMQEAAALAHYLAENDTEVVLRYLKTVTDDANHTWKVPLPSGVDLTRVRKLPSKSELQKSVDALCRREYAALSHYSHPAQSFPYAFFRERYLALGNTDEHWFNERGRELEPTFRSSREA